MDIPSSGRAHLKGIALVELAEKVLQVLASEPPIERLRGRFSVVLKILWFANIQSAHNRLTGRGMAGNNRYMPVLLLLVFRFVRLLLSGHQAVAIENAALRMQIAAFQRKRKRPVLTTVDRMFWITLRSLWSDWRHPLLYVQADTVVRWQRERFRRFWAQLSKPYRRGRGRPGTATELRRLIERMAAANPLWCAPGSMASS